MKIAIPLCKRFSRQAGSRELKGGVPWSQPPPNFPCTLEGSKCLEHLEKGQHLRKFVAFETFMMTDFRDKDLSVRSRFETRKQYQKHLLCQESLLRDWIKPWPLASGPPCGAAATTRTKWTLRPRHHGHQLPHWRIGLEVSQLQEAENYEFTGSRKAPVRQKRCVPPHEAFPDHRVMIKECWFDDE